MNEAPPTIWDVEMVVSITDGDTLRLVRSRVVEFDGRSYRLTDNEPKGIPHRLLWVDTPERGDEPGWTLAKGDLTAFALGRGPLKAVVYGSAGWDRLLVDLIDPDGVSASQWLMKERGWPPYVAS